MNEPETINSIQFFKIYTNPEVVRLSGAPEGQPFANHEEVESLPTLGLTPGNRVVKLLSKTLRIIDNVETMKESPERDQQTERIIAELTKG